MMAMCGAFFCARISTRAPAIFLPATITSFGNLTVAANANSFGIVRGSCLVDDHKLAANNCRIDIGAEFVGTQRVGCGHGASGVSSREKSMARGECVSAPMEM